MEEVDFKPHGWLWGIQGFNGGCTPDVVEVGSILELELQSEEIHWETLLLRKFTYAWKLPPTVTQRIWIELPCTTEVESSVTVLAFSVYPEGYVAASRL